MRTCMCGDTSLKHKIGQFLGVKPDARCFGKAMAKSYVEGLERGIKRKGSD